MAPMTRKRSDDDIEYDPRFPGLKVVRDGGRIRVPIHLTDGQPPEWMRRPLYDASAHRPRIAVLDRADPNVLAAEQAYRDHEKWLQDAWRTMGGGIGGHAHTTAPPAAKDGESPRDAYIRRLSEAWKTPPGSISDPDDDDYPNPVEAQRRRWLSPGATPGCDAATATKDVAVADRDAAYQGYLDRLTNGWRK